MDETEADRRERVLALLVKLEPVLTRLDEIVRRAGPDAVLSALNRLDKALNNPAARFRARKGS